MRNDVHSAVSSRSRPVEIVDKVISTIGKEIYGLHPRFVVINALLSLLPPFVGGRLRRIGLRAAGFNIGHGTMFYGMPSIIGSDNLYAHLKIGEECLFNIGCVFDVADTITIGDRVGIGHQVLIMTGSHKIGTRERRSGELITAPVVIEDGVWIGARSIILPGVTIGAGAVIGAGSMVNKDIPADTLISGNQRISLARWR
jgi:maltose O-acetyltransferase